jgi:hypothetical protein
MRETICECLQEALIDSLKILPFLFLTYLVMEYVEHRMEEKSKDTIRRSGRLGPLVGALCGAIPQCGFSTAASNLYAGRIITLGTLLAVYLSTSDEMLPIMISQQVGLSRILAIIGIKIVIALLAGFVIDLIWAKHLHIRAYAQRPHKDEEFHIDQLCENENCKCSDGILLSACKHTLHIFLYIFLFSALFNLVIAGIGEEQIAGFILNRPVLGVLLSALIGLIPNCAASVIVTSLYLKGMMSFGAMMSGLLVGAGVGLLVLCRVNESVKENLQIISLLYVCGVVGGLLLEVLQITV